MNDYEKILKEHGDLKDQRKKIDDRLEAIRDKIENLMHANQTNEINVSVNGRQWECKYQETSRKKVDYSVLKDLVSDQDYDMIVSESLTESLVIREKKSKPKKAKRGSPKPISSQSKPPQGKVGTTHSIPLV